MPSASAWLVAALVATFVSPKAGIITILFAGMLIFPVSVVLSKLLGRTGKHRKENPLAPLAIYGTIWMILSIPIAFLLSFFRPDLFFPAMLLVIGGRYLTFETLYGMKVYLFFGVALAIAGFLLAMFQAPTNLGAFIGAFIEYGFGILIFTQTKKKST
jgi:hypothetical protein